MKKVLQILFAVLMIGGFSSVFAEEDPAIILNDIPVKSDVAPVIENGRLLVPVRAVSEAFEYEISWDGKTKTVSVKDGKRVLKLTVDEKSYVWNGEKKQADVAPKIRNGRTMVPLRLISECFGCDVKWYPKTRSVVITKYKEVEVSNAEELLNAVDNYTKLILTGKEYNFTEVSGTENDWVSSSFVFDGMEYSILGINGLAMEPKAGVVPHFITEPRYAHILTFYNCKNIKIRGVTAGHTPEQGHCEGGVFQFKETYGVTMEDCSLYGCGTYGITGDQLYDAVIRNTSIYECTYGAVDFRHCEEVLFDKCTFRDTHFYGLFNFYSCKDVKVLNSSIRKNEGGVLIDGQYSTGIVFEKCVFSGNKSQEMSSGNVLFNECKFK